MKTKLLLLSLLAIAGCSQLNAQGWDSPEMQAYMRTYVKQWYEVTGKIYGVDDFEPKPYPLQGATVKVVCMGDTTEMSGGAVEKDGSVWVGIQRRDRLKDTRLKVTVSYIGMETYEHIYTPKQSKENGIDKYTVTLDSLVMKSNPVTAAEIEIVGELRKMYQRGDTVIFNADAFDMPSGSVLLDLVRRLPGLEYKDGQMKYQGEDITEIRLNGESFFKRDMSIALNNMPHDKLKALKVYEVPDDTLDAMSDEHYVMDMETKNPMNTVIFAEGNVSTNESFKNYGLGFSLSSWKQKGGQGGVNFNTGDIPYPGQIIEKTVNTNFGANYEYNFGKTSTSANIGHNYNRNDNHSANYSKMFMPDYTQNSTSESRSSNSSKNYSAGANINSWAGKTTYWGINLDYSKNESKNWNQSTDSVENEGEGLIRTTRQRNSSDSSGNNYGLNANLSKWFDEERRDELSFNFGLNTSDNKSTNYNQSYSRLLQLGDSVRDVNHRISNPNDNQNYRAGIYYMHRFGEHAFLRTGYNFNYSRNKNQQTYEDITPTGESIAYVDSLHTYQQQINMTNSADIMFRYDNDTIEFNVNTNLVPTHMNIKEQKYNLDEDVSYNGLRYNAGTNLGFRIKNNRIRLNYNISNNLPSVSQLTNVTDYSDPMNIREGNPNLKKTVSHNMGVEFQLKALMRVRFNYSTSVNSITTKTIIDRATGARRTSPANINGNWNTNEYMFFTIPIHDVTLNLTANHSLRHNVSFVQNTADPEPVKSATWWNNLNTNLSVSYSDRFWVLEGGMGYNLDKSKSDYINGGGTNGNQLRANASVSYTAPFGLELNTRCNLTRHFGYEMASANKTECIWDIEAEYRFLKAKRATLGLSWRDILNSNKGFSASMSDTFWNESRTFGNTSMFVISFSYRLNGFE